MRVQGRGLRVRGLGLGLGFEGSRFGLEVLGLGVRVQARGWRVKGLLEGGEEAGEPQTARSQRFRDLPSVLIKRVSQKKLTEPNTA